MFELACFRNDKIKNIGIFYLKIYFFFFCGKISVCLKRRVFVMTIVGY